MLQKNAKTVPLTGPVIRSYAGAPVRIMIAYMLALQQYGLMRRRGKRWNNGLVIRSQFRREFEEQICQQAITQW
jgi:hypothetical protein